MIKVGDRVTMLIELDHNTEISIEGTVHSVSHHGYARYKAKVLWDNDQSDWYWHWIDDLVLCNEK